MTLRYESEILFDLMKRDGDDTPSDVLPYESELKEKYLQQVEGAYPKLQDYRPEWLNYNLNAYIPADFPVETLSNVTSATVDNVVPYAYKSAILKGQTLVNCINQKDFVPIYATRVEIDNGYVYTQGSYNNSTRIELNYTSNPLLSNEKYYLISFRIKNNKLRTVNVITDGTEREDYTQMLAENADTFIKAKIKFAPNGTKLRIYVRCENNLDYTDDTFEIRELMLIEYQDGMENWDIPYFEGMQSVKMPVLKTTGKNLFPTNNFIECGTDNRMVGQYIYEVYLKSGNYCSSFVHADDSDKGTVLRYEVLDEQDNPVIKLAPVNRVFTIENNGLYKLKFGRASTYEGTYTKIQVQLEEGSITTPYEPFKSNILTVNEEVELRKVGDVQDELDCLTGELTQRVEEFRCEVKRVTVHGTNMGGNTRFLVELINPCPTFKDVLFNNHNFSYNSTSGYNYGADSSFYFNRQSEVFLTFEPNKYTTDTLKTYLQENPLILIIQLETESVKTVDLTVTDQDGKTTSIIRPIEGTMHVNTSSQALPPLLDMCVPVEATTQNLMSFANILEEE